MKTLEQGLGGVLLVILVVVALAQALRPWIFPLLLGVVAVGAVRSLLDRR